MRWFLSMLVAGLFMRPTRLSPRCWPGCVLVVLLAFQTGCSDESPERTSGRDGGTIALCRNSFDCPGERICRNGACIPPPPDGALEPARDAEAASDSDVHTDTGADGRSNWPDTDPPPSRDAVASDASRSDGSSDADRPPEEDGGERRDLSNAGRCLEAVDADGDGLSDACECRLGTSSGTADTDGDGLDDAAESGGDCAFEPSEGDTNPLKSDTDGDGLDDREEKQFGTDPLSVDTDGDGLDDAREVNGVTSATRADTDGDSLGDALEVRSCTEPDDSDTDDDGIPDGEEDVDRNGKLGSCSGRNYTRLCANGETDPCRADSDRDGFSDDEDTCRPRHLRQLPPLEHIDDATADYRLALPEGTRTASVSSSTDTIRADVFIDRARHYTGFVLEYASNTSTPPDSLASEVESKLELFYARDGEASVTQRAAGRARSLRGSSAAHVGTQLEISARDSSSLRPLDRMRDRLLEHLADADGLQHGLTGSLPVPSSASVRFSYAIERHGTRATLLAVLTSTGRYEASDGATRRVVDDLAEGLALARSGASLEPACIAIELGTTRTQRRLLGTPIPWTLDVEHLDVRADTTASLARSRRQGFDHDPIDNQLTFHGASVLRQRDELIVAYRRWAGSLVSCTSNPANCTEPRICVRGWCW